MSLTLELYCFGIMSTIVLMFWPIVLNRGWSEGPNAKTIMFNSFDALANCSDKEPGQNLEIHF